MAKVRVYQDIDCCLNATYNARAWRKEGDTDNAGYSKGYVHPEHDDHGVYKGKSLVKYLMEWNSRLIDALNELDYDLVWATTWREDAREVGKLMKLTPSSERVLHPLGGQTTFPSIGWKYDAILRDQINDPGPFIWVEDEINGLPTSVQGTLKDMDGLLISPDPNLGVTPKQVEQMREFIGSHTV